MGHPQPQDSEDHNEADDSRIDIHLISVSKLLRILMPQRPSSFVRMYRELKRPSTEPSFRYRVTSRVVWAGQTPGSTGTRQGSRHTVPDT